MTYQVDVPATFKFRDGQVSLEVNGKLLNLNNLDSLDEWRITLFGIATEHMAGIAGNAAAAKQPTTEPPVKPDEPAKAVQQMGDNFQQQHNRILEQTRSELEQLLGQYRAAASIYAGPTTPTNDSARDAQSGSDQSS